MSYRRGFKKEANEIAHEIRRDLKLSLFDKLDPVFLADELGIPVLLLTDLSRDEPGVSYLMYREPEAFSAVTVFAGTKRTIVHNDTHAITRQVSNLTHELAHALLHHPPTPPLDNTGCRHWNQDLEDEANWLAGALLIPEAATIAIAKGRWTITSASRHFGVSPGMVRYRINATGAVKRVSRLQPSKS